jgi:hypothetical protein
MKWTKETPKENGLYWLNRNGIFLIVDIWIGTMDGKPMMQEFGDVEHFKIFDCMEYEWYGPLEPPDSL